jgi:hypothetical protein
MIGDKIKCGVSIMQSDVFTGPMRPETRFFCYVSVDRRARGGAVG